MDKILSKIIIVITILLISTGGYIIYQQKEQNKDLTITNTNLETKLASTTQALASLQKDWDEFQASLNIELAKVSSITSQIKNITGSVDDIDKLIKTDPELLQKYSKVFFLSDNYFPTNLKMIDSKYTYNPEKDLWVKGEVLPFLGNLMNDAIANEVDIKITSAFRSFGEQAQLKSNYTVTYGTGANKFSADQGYSEHQLGTTVDFITSSGSFYNFENEDAYQWLLNNAHNYGFISSYPDDNSYYIFEPWHWRFVGKKLAKQLHEDGRKFQTLNQRELDSYLISIFD